jgi:hypothetical protein
MNFTKPVKSKFGDQIRIRLINQLESSSQQLYNHLHIQLYTPLYNQLLNQLEDQLANEIRKTNIQ